MKSVKEQLLEFMLSRKYTTLAVDSDGRYTVNGEAPFPSQMLESLLENLAVMYKLHLNKEIDFNKIKKFQIAKQVLMKLPPVIGMAIEKPIVEVRFILDDLHHHMKVPMNIPKIDWSKINP